MHCDAVHLVDVLLVVHCAQDHFGQSASTTAWGGGGGGLGEGLGGGGGTTTCDGPIKCIAQRSDNAQSVLTVVGVLEPRPIVGRNKQSRLPPTNKPDL